MKNKYAFLGAGLAAIFAAGAQAADVEVTSNITTDTVWTANNDYLLGRPIFVKEGASLTIEPGTTIYGYQDEANDTYGSLVITRGSQIFAEGTADAPIVFTALAERERELTLNDSGLWGGLIILGNAILNTPNNPAIADPGVVGTFDIEGFPAGVSDDITYGGDNDADNSGVLRYVSIRFGGYEFAQDEEINGLTLGAVGSGTTIEYVEVFNNQDDGVEMFGGTVDLKYMVMAFNEDESFDWDQGYRGRGQFWLAIQKNVGEGSNYAAEMDGGDGDDKSLQPFAIPTIANATFIGAGAGNPQDNYAFRFKENTGGYYYNSIFTDFTDTLFRVDLDDPDNGGGPLGVEDGLQYTRWEQGDLALENNIFGFIYQGGTTGVLASTPAELTRESNAVELGLATNGGVIADPGLVGISRLPDGGLNPMLAAGSAALSGTVTPVSAGSDFFDDVPFKGAFGSAASGDNWAAGWTKLSQAGYLADGGAGVGPGILDDYEMVDGGWVNSGVWLGWLFTTNYPWVWSHSLQSYIWLDEGDGEAAAGTWIYAPRPMTAE